MTGPRMATRLQHTSRALAMFRNREDAAEQLAEKLDAYRGKKPLVLGIPRGGVPMARIVADRLDGELDIVLVHKLRAPLQEELAIGAIDEAGHVTVSPWARSASADRAYLEREADEQLTLLQRRRQLYTPHRGPIDVHNRIAIAVDDGIATGATLMAALACLRKGSPSRLIAAVGVAPTHSLRQLETIADEVVCAYSSEEFYAVGQFFEDFSSVTDEDVVRALARSPVKVS